MSDSAQTTVTDYLRTLRRSRGLIALVTLLCAGLAVAYVELKTPSYEATAQLTVRDPSQDLSQLGTQAGAAQLPLQLASAHAPDVTRPAVLEQVKKDLGVQDSLDQIRSLASVNVDPNSFTVNITASDSEASEAARIANVFAQADARQTTEEARARYAASAKRLADKMRALRESGNPTAAVIYANRVSNLQGLATTARPVIVSAEAQEPSSPSSPQPVRDIAAAVVVGLLLGIGIAYARSVFDRRLRDSSAVEEVFDYPVLGRVRKDVFGHTGSSSDVEATGLGPLNPIDGEAFRMLRENLRYLALDRDLRTIVVTSAIPEEGKSTVAACLAMTNAAAGSRTLLVECDLRTRVLADRFGIDTQEVAAGAVELELVLAVDCSSSVNDAEFRLQMDGLAAAFRHPAVIKALATVEPAGITVTLLQWSGSGTTAQAVGWSLVGDALSAYGFAAAIERAPRVVAGGPTALGDAILQAAGLFGGSGQRGRRRVIDVSGDGINNEGIYASTARAHAVAQGITVNGLAILNDEPNLGRYYLAGVVGGPGAFVITASDFHDFAIAIRQKLITEITGGSIALGPRPAVPAGRASRAQPWTARLLPSGPAEQLVEGDGGGIRDVELVERR